MLLTVLAQVSAVEAEAGANPLSIDLWTWFFQSINVLVIMFLLYKLLWGPLRKIMQEREEAVESSLQRAAETKEEAERLLAEYQHQVRNADKEAQAIVDKATKAGDDARQRIIAEAEAEAEKSLARAKREIGLEREKALAAIRDEMTSLAVLAARKVVRKDISEDDHRDMVREFVSTVNADQVPGGNRTHSDRIEGNQ